MEVNCDLNSTSASCNDMLCAILSSYSTTNAYGVASQCTKGLTAYTQLEMQSNVCMFQCNAFSCLQYKSASTPLSVASIRQQFSLKVNIQLSMWSYRFLQNAAQHLTVPGDDEVDIQLFQGGYLFLASEAGKTTLKENYDVQK